MGGGEWVCGKPRLAKLACAQVESKNCSTHEEEVVVLLFGMKMEDEDVAVVDEAVVVELVTRKTPINSSLDGFIFAQTFTISNLKRFRSCKDLSFIGRIHKTDRIALTAVSSGKPPVIQRTKLFHQALTQKGHSSRESSRTGQSH